MDSNATTMDLDVVPAEWAQAFTGRSIDTLKVDRLLARYLAFSDQQLLYFSLSATDPKYVGSERDWISQFGQTLQLLFDRWSRTWDNPVNSSSEREYILEQKIGRLNGKEHSKYSWEQSSRHEAVDPGVEPYCTWEDLDSALEAVENQLRPFLAFTWVELMQYSQAGRLTRTLENEGEEEVDGEEKEEQEDLTTHFGHVLHRLLWQWEYVRRQLNVRAGGRYWDDPPVRAGFEELEDLYYQLYDYGLLDGGN